MIYTIEVTEIQKAKVEIEANSRDEAIALVEEDYFAHANDYCLDVEDTTFEVVSVDCLN